MGDLAPDVKNRNPIGRYVLLMMVPIRCFTCGGVIGDKWECFLDRVNKGDDPGQVLDDLGLTRYCCRRMLLSNVEVIDEVILYNKNQKRDDGNG